MFIIKNEKALKKKQEIEFVFIEQAFVKEDNKYCYQKNGKKILLPRTA